MKLLRTILVILILHFSVKANAQWSVKHLDESKSTQGWENLVKFKNDSLGLFMGDNSLILKSIDAGETWNPKELDFKMNLHDFQFVGDSIVFAIGDTDFENGESRVSILIKSVDDGETWDSIASFSGKQLWSLSFLDAETGFVAGYDAIYRTTDSGIHWNLVWSVPQFGYQYGEITQICFPTPQIGYSIGMGRTQPGAENNFDNFLLKTTDSGLSWDNICNLKYELASMYFLNADTGFIGTNSEIPLRTINRGQTWTEVKRIDSPIAISSIHFSSDKTGFAVGQQYGFLLSSQSAGSFFISKTTDSGETWETFNSPGIPLNSIYFINDTTGLVSGAFSLIMKSNGKIDELPSNYPWDLVDDGSGVKDIDEPNLLVKAFPNPTSGILNIQPKNTDQTVQTIRLFNSSGQPISIGIPDLNNENIQIDLSGLVSGMYFFQVTFSGKTELIKVMKK
jgi:photosystem II stability/assembly factor-like uncharacterized protein